MPSPGGVAQFIDGGEFGWLAGWACAGTDKKEKNTEYCT
jgi:hypothetical protein